MEGSSPELEKWSGAATADAAHHQLELLWKLGLPSTAPSAAAEQVGPPEPLFSSMPYAIFCIPSLVLGDPQTLPPLMVCYD
eukprot:4832143-Pleurochrysis_carterae.AAC.1